MGLAFAALSVNILTIRGAAHSGCRIGALSLQELMMPEPSELSRRERQIMDAVFTLGEATVNKVVETIPSPPTAMAVRRMMHILEEKGHLRRRESGREVIYAPRQAKDKAGRRAFERVLETFFGGSLEEALAAHLHSRKDQVSVDERERLIKLIEQAHQEGR
jgi:predicted transcriptional regulator